MARGPLPSPTLSLPLLCPATLRPPVCAYFTSSPCSTAIFSLKKTLHCTQTAGEGWRAAGSQVRRRVWPCAAPFGSSRAAEGRWPVTAWLAGTCPSCGADFRHCLPSHTQQWTPAGASAPAQEADKMLPQSLSSPIPLRDTAVSPCNLTCLACNRQYQSEANTDR